MPGIIFDIKRFAVHDGPGIRTTVFLKGCPLRCRWCHNPESWLPDPETADKKVILDGKEFTDKEIIGRLVSAGEVMAELEKERLIMEESGGGITFSGGEPLMQPLFLQEMLVGAAAEGFHTAVDTSGYAPRDALEIILPWAGLFLFDIKLIDNNLHHRYTGVSNAIILENFTWLAKQGKPLRVRIPLIRGITATTENIGEIIRFLAPHMNKIEQVDLLSYHRTGMNKFTKLGLPCEMPGNDAKPGKQELEEIRMKFENSGFNIKIGG